MSAASLELTDAEVDREQNDCETGTASDSLSVTTDHIVEDELRVPLRTITEFWRSLDAVHVDRPPTDPNDTLWVTATLADGTYLVAGQPPDGVFELSAITECTRRD